MTRLFFILALFTAQVSCHAQISMNDFLRSALNDSDVKGFQEQAAYLQRKPYQLSPIQRVEVRAQVQEMNAGYNQYALRFTPANPWEVRNNNRYFSSLTGAVALEGEIMLKEAMLERVYCIIESAYYLELKSLERVHRKLLRDQILILEKQSGSSFFDADEYLDLQVDQLDQDVEIAEVDLEMLNLLNQAELLAGSKVSDSLSWTFASLIPVSRVLKVVDSLTQRSIKSLVQTYHQQQINVATSEYKLEKANVNIGFLQTEFDKQRYDQYRVPWNFSIGVTLPIFNPNKGDMAKRKLEIIEATYELEEEKQQADQQGEMLQERIARIVKWYNELEEKIAALDNSVLASSLSKLEGGNPRMVLRFNENKVKLRVLQAKLYRDLLLAYADFLAFSDRLQQRPLVNYIAKDFYSLE